MNAFVAIGELINASSNGRVLKFDLAVRQEKPCHVPCVLFDPTDEVKDFVNQLQTKKQAVWLQGRVASYEFQYQGKTIRKIRVITYGTGIRPI